MYTVDVITNIYEYIVYFVEFETKQLIVSHNIKLITVRINVFVMKQKLMINGTKSSLSDFREYWAHKRVYVMEYISFLFQIKFIILFTKVSRYMFLDFL